MQIQIDKYPVENIHNMYETGIFYRTLPSKNACEKRKRDTKNLKAGFQCAMCEYVKYL